MNLVNMTSLSAGLSVATDKYGRQSIVAVAKGTFAVKPDGSTAVANQQQPLVDADEFAGEPGVSAVIYETDFAPRKPVCDVLLDGCARAPGGRSVTSVTVSLEVSSVHKSFRVVGDRLWHWDPFGYSATEPEPFTIQQFSYATAFGGADLSHPDPTRHRTFQENPVGVGFHVNHSLKDMDGKPLPNTEEAGAPVTKADGHYRPMAFGAIGRNFKSRISWAGTYDSDWLESSFPFLPADFDERYYQAAPADQQCPYLSGGEVVSLTNLSPDGRLSFIVPAYDVPVRIIHAKGTQLARSVVDTLVVEPQKSRFMMTWRASIEPECKLTRVRAVWVGTPSPGRLRASQKHKRYLDWSS